MVGEVEDGGFQEDGVEVFLGKALEGEPFKIMGVVSFVEGEPFTL